MAFENLYLIVLLTDTKNVSILYELRRLEKQI